MSETWSPKEELKIQRKITTPLAVTNLTWLAKVAVTTAFLGRLGSLELAGGGLGFTFANVTGFSVLNGLCHAMEPISGQAFGAQNFKLVHKTLLMTSLLLFSFSIPIAFLWLKVDEILLLSGQDRRISGEAKRFLLYLLPDLAITSILSPAKTYLSSQGTTFPTMIASALGLLVHVLANALFFAKEKGIAGVATAMWLSEGATCVALAWWFAGEKNNWREGGWWDQSWGEWGRLARVAGPTCLTTCLEWWCYEILVLLSGRLRDARLAIGVVVIVLNFDYLLYAIMLSIATCASVRVSNELGAGKAGRAFKSARVSLAVGSAAGLAGGTAMALTRRAWGPLFTRDPATLEGVERALPIMALIEVINFPVAVSGGILRGTERPWLAVSSFLGGFYLVALPLAVALAFEAGLWVRGLFLGFLVGIAICLALLLVFVSRIDWEKESRKAQDLSEIPIPA